MNREISSFVGSQISSSMAIAPVHHSHLKSPLRPLIIDQKTLCGNIYEEEGRTAFFHIFLLFIQQKNEKGLDRAHALNHAQRFLFTLEPI